MVPWPVPCKGLQLYFLHLFLCTWPCPHPEVFFLEDLRSWKSQIDPKFPLFFVTEAKQPLKLYHVFLPLTRKPLFFWSLLYDFSAFPSQAKPQLLTFFTFVLNVFAPVLSVILVWHSTTLGLSITWFLFFLMPGFQANVENIEWPYWWKH
jgi:hypothetical protein